MKIVKSKILSEQKNLIFSFSTKYSEETQAPYYFNMSYSVGDNPNRVTKNREKFYSELGLSSQEIAYQKQIHSDKVTVVTSAGFKNESDALITNVKNLGLAISSADCVAVFLYDKKGKVIAGVHSGWRGTEKKILIKTLGLLQQKFNSKPENIIAYISPSITQKNYEVDLEVAEKFDGKYWKPIGNKYLLDIAEANYDMLLYFGIPKVNIEKSDLCSYETDYLHSYRRDGKISGRAFGVIAMKE